MNARISACKTAAIKTAVCIFSAALAAATIGCGLGGNPSIGSSASSTSPTMPSKVKHDGAIYGGQQPITGADIKLYAAGTTGYGQGAASLMNTTVTTDANGFFTLTNSDLTDKYSCTPGQQVYLVSKGGTEINSTTAVSITSYSATTSVVTFTAANSLAAGQSVTLSGFTTTPGTAYNGTTVTVLATGLSSSQFEATIAGTATASATADTGIATPTTLGSNTQIALMAALGTCPSAGNFSTVGNGAISFINVNELTTAATVWALQQFMAAPAAGNVGAPSIGAPSTQYCNTGSSTVNPSSTASCNVVSGVTPVLLQPGLTGLSNAFKMASIITDITQGTIPNTNYSYATPETAKLTSISNILASCVNSAGGAAPGGVTDGSICGNLFSYVTPSGSTAAADTTQAAWYMAQNPTLNVASAYGLITGAGAAFSGGLSSAPKDWTVAVNFAPTYSGGTTKAVDAAYGVSIDAYGNAWISNTGGVASSAPAGLMELGADGSAITTPLTTVTASTTGTGAYTQITTAPTTNTYTAFTAPKIVQIDLNNKPWVTLNNMTTGAVPTPGMVLSVAGSSSTQTGGTGATSMSSAAAYYTNYQPVGLAIDGNNNIYVASGTTSSISQTTLMNARSVSKMAADGTNYVYSTSSGTVDTTAAYTTPGSQALLAIDTNTAAASGGQLWAISFNTCKTANPNYGAAATTPWGVASMYALTTLAPAPLSDVLTVYSSTAATTPSVLTTGNSTTGNCQSSTSIYTGQSITAPMTNTWGIAIDANNGVWITDTRASSIGFGGLTYLSAPNSSDAIPSSGYFADTGVSSTPLGSSTLGWQANTTIVKGAGDLVDGNNHVWVTDQSAASITEASVCNSYTTPTCSTPTITYMTPGAGGTGGVGFVHSISAAAQVAIDPSGNVWAGSTGTTNSYTNQSASTTLDANSVTVIVGGAGPVLTPLSVAIANNHIGQKP
ncbi:MAG: hypothetical protein P4L10_08555 [Acidobacteriaceae bacterium]|nr:hypothetical protein [Acidobacteriaceae bacterium]